MTINEDKMKIFIERFEKYIAPTINENREAFKSYIEEKKKKLEERLEVLAGKKK